MTYILLAAGYYFFDKKNILYYYIVHELLPQGCGKSPWTNEVNKNFEYIYKKNKR